MAFSRAFKEFSNFLNFFDIAVRVKIKGKFVDFTQIIPITDSEHLNRDIIFKSSLISLIFEVDETIG